MSLSKVPPRYPTCGTTESPGCGIGASTLGDGHFDCFRLLKTSKSRRPMFSMIAAPNMDS
ncbi:hypothetical protein R3Q08_31470 [Rhodococcus erythropolis]|uniref:hypothetical protein n=1 Tax=Rhodococcus erythropolis TaxID=1833 RepID=UPI00294A39C6|nr:hypothetical protein [Rhodococcus erythropolis]MDV6212775.1 hypothetical protein [Rhodococcus erythropolis]